MSEVLAQGRSIIRGILPTATVLVLMLFEFLPYRLAHIQAVMPHLFLAAAFYWALHRPDLMNTLLLFILGLAYDLANGGVVGFTSAMLVAMRFFVISQRRVLAGTVFVLSWVGFIGVAIVYGIAHWLLMSMVIETPVSFTVAAMQILMTISVYPVVARLIGQVHRRTLDL